MPNIFPKVLGDGTVTDRFIITYLLHTAKKE